MYEGTRTPGGGKSLKRVRSDSVGSNSSPLSRASSEGGYSRAPQPTIQEKKAQVILAKMENMTEDQQERFEFFARSHFDKEVIKKHMIESFAVIKAGSSAGLTEEVRNRKLDLNEYMVMIMGALCKLFVGDLVRGATILQSERGEEGPISPRHIREVYRRLVRSKELPLLRGTSVVDMSSS